MKKCRKFFVFTPSNPPYVPETEIGHIKAGDVFYAEEPDGSLNSNFGEFLGMATSDADGWGADAYFEFIPLTHDRLLI